MSIIPFVHDGNPISDCVVNSLYCGEMSAKCSHVSPEKLYDYLKKEAENLGMKALKLTQDKEDCCEHALVRLRI